MLRGIKPSLQDCICTAIPIFNITQGLGAPGNIFISLLCYKSSLSNSCSGNTNNEKMQGKSKRALQTSASVTQKYTVSIGMELMRAKNIFRENIIVY